MSTIDFIVFICFMSMQDSFLSIEKNICFHRLHNSFLTIIEFTKNGLLHL